MMRKQLLYYPNAFNMQKIFREPASSTDYHKLVDLKEEMCWFDACKNGIDL